MCEGGRSENSLLPTSSSAPQPGRSENEKKHNKVNILSLPDEVLQLIHLYVLESPEMDGTLGHCSLEHFEYAIWLAQAHPYLRRALQRAIRAIELLWMDSVSPDEIAVVAKCLKRVSISGHARADLFLQALAGLSLELEVLELDSVFLPGPSIVSLLAPVRLKVLSLSFISVQNLSDVLTSIIPSLSSLTSLKLRGLSNLDGPTIIAICQSASSSLKTISLRYLRHITLSDLTLYHISTACPNLTDICIEELHFVAVSAVTDFCMHYGTKLTSLRLQNVGLSCFMLHLVASACPSLTQLSVQDTQLLYLDGQSLVDAFILRGPSLRAIDIRGVRFLNDLHVSRMVHAAPCLQSLTLRWCLKLTDDAVLTAITSERGAMLRKLDLRGCCITDISLRWIGLTCTALEHIALGSDGANVHPLTVPLFDPNAVSNKGMDRVLVSCGKSLKTFFWETPRTMLDSDGITGMKSLGVERLNAKTLGESLLKYCPNLVRVEVNWLRPPVSRVFDRGESDLAYFELDCNVKGVIFLDKEPL